MATDSTPDTGKFDALVAKLMKQHKMDREHATKLAGWITRKNGQAPDQQAGGK